MALNRDKDTIRSTDEYRWNLLLSKAAEQRAAKAFALFREHNIEPVLIKGWAAAQYYPEGQFRLSIDTDLAVSRDDFDRANKITKTADAEGLAIDLHCELRHLDTLAWEDLFEGSHQVSTEFGDLRILRPEDHLRVLCVHWLTDGGSSKERLWDIYYAISRRSDDFDWSRFLDFVSSRRRRWLVCTVGLAQRFLDLDLAGTPFEKEASDLPEWLIQTVEKEWAAERKMRPLETAIKDRKELFEQLKRRLNPNPIWATVHMEGSFDARTRFFYKAGNALARILPSYRRISSTIRSRPK